MRRFPWFDPLVHTHKFAAAAGILAVVSVLGACSTASDVEVPAEPTSQASVTVSPESSADVASAVEAGGEPCDLVDTTTVADLAGRDIGAPRETTVGALPACQWHDGDVSIQVAQVAAAEWAVALPALAEGVRQSGGFDETDLARFEKAAKLVESGKVDPAAACDMFSMLIEFSGYEPGTDRSVNLVPNAQAPQAISGQACVDGVYSSVLLVAPGLSMDSPEVSAVDVALNKLIAAGV